MSLTKSLGLLTVLFFALIVRGYSQTARPLDSLSLVSFYNATGGPGWTNKWILSTPVRTWYGVKLDAQGFVISLVVGNNNLVGNIPADLGNLSRLTGLELDNNKLSGAIPADLGKLTNLNRLFLDNNLLTGNIPKELGNLKKLISLFLDNNRLTGTVPAELVGVPGLSELYLHNNRLDSLPNLSTLNLQIGKFTVDHNRLTFDDILPNIARLFRPSSSDQYYAPQDSIGNTTRLQPCIGRKLTINLGIDAGISTNVYQWFRNGTPFGAPSNSNVFEIPVVTPANGGRYQCRITNPGAPALTLWTKSYYVNPICCPVSVTLKDTLCEGQSVTIRGETFDKDNPVGTVFAGTTQFGCDSIIIVDLRFVKSEPNVLLRRLCPGGSLVAGGETFNAARPSGTVVLKGQGIGGCDSVIQVNLTFFPAIVNVFRKQICAGETIRIGTQIFDETRLTGSVLFPGGSWTGCDSTVNVELTIGGSQISFLHRSFCDPNAFVLVNNVRYDRFKTTGTETITRAGFCDSVVDVKLTYLSNSVTTLRPLICRGATYGIEGFMIQDTLERQLVLPGRAANGCDSIINLKVRFEDRFPVSFQTVNLCAGDSITIHGQTFSERRRSGIIRFPNASWLGCDSSLVVNTDFFEEVTGIFTRTLCQGQTLNINGTVYSELNPTGLEILKNASYTGCDSTVYINLSFKSFAPGSINRTICESDSILVHGLYFSKRNPVGIINLPGGSSLGCDSIIIVQLSIHSPVKLRDDILCNGTSINIAGNIYDATNPTDDIVLTGQSYLGCDSVIQVRLQFSDASVNIINPVLCATDTFVFKNRLYYYPDKPSGQFRYPNASVAGCDSIDQITPQWIPQAIRRVEGIQCFGTTLTIEGKTYSASNPTDSIKLSVKTAQGCDSFLVVNLTFLPELSTTISGTRCYNEFVQVNGNRYDRNRPSGTEIISNWQGCDSTVLINLTFLPLASGNLQLTTCKGQSVTLNGYIYSESNPGGVQPLGKIGNNGQCDSTLTVNINFIDPPASVINQSICEGDTLYVGNEKFYAGKLSGTVGIPVPGLLQCDSTVTVNLQLLPVATGKISAIICEGQTYTLHGRTFNQDGVYTFTIDQTTINGCDSLVELTLDVLSEGQLGSAYAGEDQNTCDNTVLLEAELPQGVTGKWTGPGVIQDPTAPVTTVNTVPSGSSVFIWTLSSAECPNYTADTVVIVKNTGPEAVEDNMVIAASSTGATLDLSTNDQLQNQTGILYNTLNLPSVGNWSISPNGLLTFVPGVRGNFNVQGTYIVCSSTCPDDCDSAKVNIRIYNDLVDTTVSIPNAITPNGDGLNDVFYIDLLDDVQTDTEGNQLVIVNRWGDIVYSAKPYRNNWNGVNDQGDELPEGTYYYIFTLNLSKGQVYKGDVTILRRRR